MPLDTSGQGEQLLRRFSETVNPQMKPNLRPDLGTSGFGFVQRFTGPPLRFPLLASDILAALGNLHDDGQTASQINQTIITNNPDDPLVNPNPTDPPVEPTPSPPPPPTTSPPPPTTSPPPPTTSPPPPTTSPPPPPPTTNPDLGIVCGPCGNNDSCFVYTTSCVGSCDPTSGEPPEPLTGCCKPVSTLFCKDVDIGYVYCCYGLVTATVVTTEPPGS